MKFWLKSPLMDVVDDGGAGGGTPPPAQHVRTFTQDQVDEFVTRARREEKEKLYADLDRLKRQSADAEAKLRDAEEKLKGAGPNSDAAAVLRQKIEQLEAASQQATARFEQALNDALDRQRAEFSRVMQERDLSSFKDALIAGANGQVIPELVTGNTREEIQASFERAQTRFRDIADAAAKAVEDKLKGALPRPITPGQTQAGEHTDVQGGPDAWRNLSPAEWEAKKAEIKKQMFDKAGLPMRAR